MTQNRRPIKGDGVTCTVEGCNQPRHKTYVMCIDHRREYENARKRERNARARAKRAFVKQQNTFTAIDGYPDLLIVQRLEGDKIGNVVMYKPVRVIPASDARMNYSDSNRVAQTDNVILFKAKFNPKTKPKRGRYE